MAKDQPQPAVYEVATRTLLQQVMSAQAALVLEGIEAPVYNELQKELRAAVETIDSQAEERQVSTGHARTINAGPLTKIKVFEDLEYQAISEKADDEADRGRCDVMMADGLTTIRKFREAMIKHLLPINVVLLDLPVQERYHQAFQTGWKKLDGLENQITVAVSSATTKKKSLRDILEE